MDHKERFTDRVEAYVKYRPGYPVEALDHLYGTVGLNSGSVVADIGAGTGIFTRLLLARGSTVIAVEPNQAMREQAVRESEGNPRFRPAAGSAENTGLPDESVDFVVCAQSFHWFDRTAAQEEFRRILKPGGKVALIWNSRLTRGTPFRERYDLLLRTYGIDYEKVGHKNISLEALRHFFRNGGPEVARFESGQTFDFEGLKGRTLSSSYVPHPGHPNHDPMMAELRRIFDDTQKDGQVSFEYETEIYWGEV